MASQLLLEQGDVTQTSAIIEMALADAAPEVRVLAMHIADRLGALDVQHVRELVNASHPRVVETALALAREHGWGEQLVGSFQSLAQRAEPRVQLELAAICADLDSPAALETLRAMLPATREPLVQSVLAIAAGDRSWQLFAGAAQNQMSSLEFGHWLERLLPVWAEKLPDSPELRNWIEQQLLDSESARHAVWLDSVSRLSNGRQVGNVLNCLPENERQKWTASIEAALENNANPQWVRLLDRERRQIWVAQLLEPTQSSSVLGAAIRVVGLSSDPELDQILLAAFPSLTPALQDRALRVLIQRADSTQALLTAVEAGKVKSSQISPDLRLQILSSNDASLASRAKMLLGRASQDRLAVIERYTAAYDDWQPDELSPTDLHVVRTHGRQQFERVCGQCHRVEGVGHDVGAALTQLSTKSPRQLIEAILDPNREVDPRYSGYSVLLVDGRIVTGVIREETAGQIVIVAAGGEVLSVKRDDIEQIKSTGLSLMPTGIEEQLSPQQLAEVLVFLRNLENE